VVVLSVELFDAVHSSKVFRQLYVKNDTWHHEENRTADGKPEAILYNKNTHINI